MMDDDDRYGVERGVVVVKVLFYAIMTELKTMRTPTMFTLP
jgi:hypothetical protein